MFAPVIVPTAMVNNWAASLPLWVEPVLLIPPLLFADWAHHWLIHMVALARSDAIGTVETQLGSPKRLEPKWLQHNACVECAILHHTCLCCQRLAVLRRLRLLLLLLLPLPLLLPIPQTTAEILVMSSKFNIAFANAHRFCQRPTSTPQRWWSGRKWQEKKNITMADRVWP